MQEENRQSDDNVWSRKKRSPLPAPLLVKMVFCRHSRISPASIRNKQNCALLNRKGLDVPAEYSGTSKAAIFVQTRFAERWSQI